MAGNSMSSVGFRLLWRHYLQAYCSSLIWCSPRHIPVHHYWFGPACFCSESLEVLDLSENNLSGNLPEQPGDGHHLAMLKLSNNFLGGTLPDTFSSLQDADLLDLASNNLSTGNQLPSWVVVSS
jgi:hypothetical protein